MRVGAEEELYLRALCKKDTHNRGHSLVVSEIVPREELSMILSRANILGKL